jgi:streptogramin lyase
MKQICVALVLLIFIFPVRLCGQTATPAQQSKRAPLVDPYFVMSWDTVSQYGPHTITRNILQDRKGNFWFASWQGIICYDGKAFTNITLKENLIHFHVLSLFEDKAGNLWFGTVRGGLYKYDGKTFTLFTTENGLTDNTVQCMLEDKAGNIWFGTDAGVSRYNVVANSGEMLGFTKKDGFTDEHVSSIIEDKTGKLWFGTHDGIYLFDGKQFSVFENKEGLLFKDIRSLLEDKNGNIWIAMGAGLWRYDPTVTNDRSFTELMKNPVSYLFEDKAGNIWLSVIESNAHDPNVKQDFKMVLLRYDLETTNGNSFTRIIEKYKPKDVQVFGITEDKDGNIWFGTMKGVCRYDAAASKTFTYFTR